MSRVANSLKKNLSNVYILIALMIVLAAVATYFVPSGVYDRVSDAVTGKTVIDPNSFHYVAQTPVGFFDALKSIPNGMVDAGLIIFFVLIVAGAFEVVNETGMTSALIGTVIRKAGKREKLLIFSIIFVFSIMAGTIGTADEIFVFVPLLLLLCKDLGYDAIVACALAYLGVRTGHINGLINPFNVGVAQAIAELPLYSGLWFRSIFYVITLDVCICRHE